MEPFSVFPSPIGQQHQHQHQHQQQHLPEKEKDAKGQEVSDDDDDIVAVKVANRTTKEHSRLGFPSKTLTLEVLRDTLDHVIGTSAYSLCYNDDDADEVIISSELCFRECRRFFKNANIKITLTLTNENMQHVDTRMHPGGSTNTHSSKNNNRGNRSNQCKSSKNSNSGSSSSISVVAPSPNRGSNQMNADRHGVGQGPFLQLDNLIMPLFSSAQGKGIAIPPELITAKDKEKFRETRNSKTENPYWKSKLCTYYSKGNCKKSDEDCPFFHEGYGGNFRRGSSRSNKNGQNDRDGHRNSNLNPDLNGSVSTDSLSGIIDNFYELSLGIPSSGHPSWQQQPQQNRSGLNSLKVPSTNITGRDNRFPTGEWNGGTSDFLMNRMARALSTSQLQPQQTNSGGVPFDGSQSAHSGIVEVRTLSLDSSPIQPKRPHSPMTTLFNHSEVDASNLGNPPVMRTDPLAALLSLSLHPRVGPSAVVPPSNVSSMAYTSDYDFEDNASINGMDMHLSGNTANRAASAHNNGNNHLDGGSFPSSSSRVGLSSTKSIERRTDALNWVGGYGSGDFVADDDSESFVDSHRQVTVDGGLQSDPTSSFLQQQKLAMNHQKQQLLLLQQHKNAHSTSAQATGVSSPTSGRKRNEKSNNNQNRRNSNGNHQHTVNHNNDRSRNNSPFSMQRHLQQRLSGQFPNSSNNGSPRSSSPHTSNGGSPVSSLRSV